MAFHIVDGVPWIDICGLYKFRMCDLLGYLKLLANYLHCYCFVNFMNQLSEKNIITDPTNAVDYCKVYMFSKSGHFLCTRNHRHLDIDRFTSDIWTSVLADKKTITVKPSPLTCLVCTYNCMLFFVWLFLTKKVIKEKSNPCCNKIDVRFLWLQGNSQTYKDKAQFVVLSVGVHLL